MSKGYISASPLSSHRFVQGTLPRASSLELIRTMLNGMHGEGGVKVRLLADGIVIEMPNGVDLLLYPWKTEVIIQEDEDIVRLHPGARQVAGSDGEWVSPPTGEYFEWPLGTGGVVWMSYNFSPEDDETNWTGPEYGEPPAETPTLHVRRIAVVHDTKEVVQHQYGTIIVWDGNNSLPAGEDNRDLMRWDADEERWVFFPYSQPTLGEGEIPVLSATDTTLAWGRVTGTIDDANIPDDDDGPCDQNIHPDDTEDEHPGEGVRDDDGLGLIDREGYRDGDPDYHPGHDDCFTSVPPTETTP